MGKYYYKKSARINIRKYFRILSILLLLLGSSIVFYVLFPFISWQIYFQPVFASQHVVYSIPKKDIVETSVISSILSQTKNTIERTDFSNAYNWFPEFKPGLSGIDYSSTPTYTISIPKINIVDAVVSTMDNDLTKHLVNFQGTSIPGKKGNAVIFGHSTLPQLFNPQDYKIIFANAYKLKNGDGIYATVNNVKYTYNIFKITVVDPSDSSAMEQDLDNSYITLVTCTPPGTIWKRLVVKARLEKI